MCRRAEGQESTFYLFFQKEKKILLLPADDTTVTVRVRTGATATIIILTVIMFT